MVKRSIVGCDKRSRAELRYLGGSMPHDYNDNNDILHIRVSLHGPLVQVTIPPSTRNSVL